MQVQHAPGTLTNLLRVAVEGSLPVEERSAAFKYLGLQFEATTDGFARSLGESLACARKVMINLLSLCAQISLTCPHGICKLVDALVLPILSYGCEVWFWDHRVGTRATAQAESLHAQALWSAPACAHPDCTC